MLKIVAGLEVAEGEQAKILLNKDARIGYLDQEPDFHDSLTAIEAIFEDTENPQLLALKAYEEAMLEPENAKKLEAALILMDERKAWDIEASVKKYLVN